MANTPTPVTSTEKLKEIKEAILKQIIERVTLVKSSLLSTHYQNRWSSVGLQQIINRFFLLLQKRCVVVVLEKKTNIGYRILHHTCLDPYWKYDFENYINELYDGFIPKKEALNDLIVISKLSEVNKKKVSGKKKEDIEIGEIDDFLIRFYGNKYFMIHRMLPDINKTKRLDTIRQFPPIKISNDNNLSLLVSELRNSLDNERMARFFRNEKINEEVPGKREEWNKKKLAKNLPYQLDQDWKAIPEGYFDKHFQKIKVVFDQEYKKIHESPLLTSNNDLPNIFFSIRMFSQRECRFKYNEQRIYPYGVRLLIPDTQKKDLRKAFERLKNDCHLPENRPRNTQDQGIDDNFFWEKLDEPKDSEGRLDALCNILDELKLTSTQKEDFRKALIEQKKDGIDEILDDLELSYGLGARAISDTVFESGYVNIKESPLAFGGSNRFEKELLETLDKSTDKSSISDYRIAVYFHYMLLMLFSQRNNLPADNENDFSIILAPGSVGGSPYFCTGFVFKRTKKRKDQEGQEKQANEENHQNWLDNFHFYHDVRHYLVRSVRRKLGDLYLQEIHNTYESCQDDLLEEIASVGSLTLEHFEFICDRLNQQFRILSRVYPFRCIKYKAVLSHQTDEDKEPYSFLLHYIGSELQLAVFIGTNPFFTLHVDDEQFLKTEQVHRYLYDADKKVRGKLKKMADRYQKKHNTRT